MFHYFTTTEISRRLKLHFWDGNSNITDFNWEKGFVSFQMAIWICWFFNRFFFKFHTLISNHVHLVKHPSRKLVIYYIILSHRILKPKVMWQQFSFMEEWLKEWTKLSEIMHGNFLAKKVSNYWLIWKNPVIIMSRCSHFITIWSPFNLTNLIPLKAHSILTIR